MKAKNARKIGPQSSENKNEFSNLCGPYLSDPTIKSIHYSPERKSFVMNGKPFPGIHSTLSRIFYPDFERKRRNYKTKKKRARKASCIAEGKKIDEQIEEYAKSGKRPKIAMAKALVSFWEDHMEHKIEAAQVPCHIRELGVVTTADVITSDSENRLWMWEVKAGYNQAQKQGSMNYLPGVPCRPHEHWELQRHYTHKGLVECGLPIFASHVVNVFREKEAITVKKRKVPKWTEKLSRIKFV